MKDVANILFKLIKYRDEEINHLQATIAEFNIQMCVNCDNYKKIDYDREDLWFYDCRECDGKICEDCYQSSKIYPETSHDCFIFPDCTVLCYRCYRTCKKCKKSFQVENEKEDKPCDSHSDGCSTIMCKECFPKEQRIVLDCTECHGEYATIEFCSQQCHDEWMLYIDEMDDNDEDKRVMCKECYAR